MSFVVRAPRVSDARAIARLRNAVWRSAYPGMVSQDLLAGLDDARGTLVWEARLEATNARGVDHNGVTVRVAVDIESDRVVGMGEVTPTPGDVAPVELTMFNIDPDVSRQGLGSRLLAVLTGARDCAAWVVAGNVRAQQFFARNGFALTDQRRTHLKFETPEVLMVRRGWSAPGL